MKFILAVLIVIISFQFTNAQEVKPLTQTEYVRLLYVLEKDSSTLEDLISTIRTRGIGFELTDGLRSLTRTKSRNDSELRRTLEESDRRRVNPSAAKLPSETESKNILANARAKTLEAVAEMPDFVVKQDIVRSAAYAGTNNFRNLDKLIVAVSYRASGFEEYKVLSINGVLQNEDKSKQSFEQVGGTSSTGEFVTVLALIFKPESETKFELVDTDVLRGRRSVVYDFEIELEKAKQRITASGYISDTTTAGMKGRIWIDRENFRVLKIVSEATEIPSNFPIRTATRTIDYDWVKISDEDYLLPLVSDVRLTIRESKNVYETRNLIRFKNYQKYGTEITILDDEEEIPVDPDQPPPIKKP
ncbi:MAG: hypothetical protein KIS76_13190 [Pyrinomonadaceae bacterium]|nr:hypothetical protein [Pyrinomonadaceae bacterium]